jgi:Tol biopolymer transport system component
VSLAGGAPQTICDLPSTVVGGSWSRDGVVIVGNAFGGIMRCPADGGAAAAVTRAGPSEEHLFPSFLPDGRHFVYLRVSRTKPEESGVYLGALDTDPSHARRLFTSGFACTYAPAVDGGAGFLVFGRDGALFAQRFDERRLELTGEAVQLAAAIGSFFDYPFFTASATTLVYREPGPPSQITWFNRRGAEIGRVGAPERLSGLALSPNDDRLLVVRHTPQNTADENLWLFDLATASYQRVTATPAIKLYPVWTSRDRFIYSMSGGDRGIQEQVVGQQPRLLFKSDRSDIATSASGDGRLLLYTHLIDGKMGTDVWLRDTRTDSGAGVPLITGEFDQGEARLSPDQRFIAYVSNETGYNEVYVAELHQSTSGTFAIGNRTPVSRGGGFAPRWRADGRELFYLTPAGSLIAVSVTPTHGPRTGSSERLFNIPGVAPEWDVSQDGQRFLFAVPTAPPASYNVVVNWQSMLRR